MGPLSGKRVIEFAGLGPAPFAAMMLSDLGADVIRIERIPPRSDSGHEPTGVEGLSDGIMTRGRRTIALDLKNPDGLKIARALIADADVVLEGFRPGAMERLGLGPDVCLEANPRLIYGRVTGWGQEGPYAQSAGHDLNYIALSGALAPLGRRDEPPVAPLNLLGDFAGGGLLVVTGILAALVSVATTGQGQTVDAAMVDGSAYLMTMMFELLGKGLWVEERESNANDGGAHFYGVYETADHRYISIAAMEPQFYSALLARLDLDGADLPEQWDAASWPVMRGRFEEIFRGRTRDEWCDLLEGPDTCFAPVLTMSEAPHHPHNLHRQAFSQVDGANIGVMTPSPAPRFTRTPLDMRQNVRELGRQSDEILIAAGFRATEIAGFREGHAVV
jgi:alpha-methylacyl-CoA racemase